MKGLDHDGHPIDGVDGDEERYDIDTDAGRASAGPDSAIGASEDGESPLRRQLSFLHM
jgi:hypothetical protein